MSVWVKICGITSVADALLAVEAGADAIGLNFVPASPRRVDEATALAIVRAVGPRLEKVGVVADLELDALRTLRERVGLDRLQLHGHEPPEVVRQLAPLAFKAVRIENARDVEQARSYPGERLLVDAARAGVLGGSGERFDWELVRELSRERRLILAGGLSPENVAEAMATVAPWGLDVATGVESQPGSKDGERVRAFVTVARAR